MTNSTSNSSPASPSSAPPLNYDELVRRCMGKIELVERLLNSFESRFPGEISQIEESLADGDRPRLNRLVHQLKGSVSNVSASALQAVMIRMDEAAQADRLDEVLTCLNETRQQWEAFIHHRATRSDAARSTGKSCLSRGS